jgi:hypothetical protein
VIGPLILHLSRPFRLNWRDIHGVAHWVYVGLFVMPASNALKPLDPGVRRDDHIRDDDKSTLQIVVYM